MLNVRSEAVRDQVILFCLFQFQIHGINAFTESARER